MSNAEKSIRLKQCLKTIGVRSPQLSSFIKRSLAIDKKIKQNMKKAEALDRHLGKLQAEALDILLST